MTELSPEDALGMRNAAASLAGRWVALHQKAAQVAHMARLGPEPFAGDIAAFPARLAAVPDGLQMIVEQSLEDIEVLLHTGLTALEAIADRSQSAQQSVQSPALALWREFHAARAALLGLLGHDRQHQTIAA